MKKRMTILLAIVAALILAVSCSMDNKTPDDTSASGYAYVTFGTGSSRDLSSTYGIKSYDSLYWYYEAAKDDKNGYSGVTTGPVKIGTGPGLASDQKIGPFSVGAWTFTISAYSTDSATDANLVYQGKVSTKLDRGETKAIPVTVTPQGEKGTVKFDGAYFQWNDNAGGDAEVKVSITLESDTYTYQTNLSLSKNDGKYLLNGNLDDNASEEAATALVKETNNIPAGYYQATVVVELSTGDYLPVAEQSFGLRVYGSAETIITGNLVEGVDSWVNFIIAESEMTIFESGTQEVSVAIAPTTSADYQKTTVNFGSHVLADDTYFLDVEVIPRATAESRFNITQTEGTTTYAVAALDLTLTGATTGGVTQFNDKVTVSTYITPGLPEDSVGVVYYVNGEPDQTEGSQPTNISYTPSSGLLTFETTHFSTFVVTAQSDSRFAGGNGTSHNPYIIETPEQFLKIADLSDNMKSGEYYYFSVTKDLNFASSESIGIVSFRGEIDFNDHWVTNISKSNLATGFITFIDDIIEGKISNLNYNPGDTVAFAYNNGWTSGAAGTRSEWVTTFDNVDVYGTYEDVGNNFSLYILQAFDGTLEFRNCTNYAHITGLLYNGAFLGGYPQVRTTGLVYENCEFAGEMRTKNAGFCTGNAAQVLSNTDAISVTGCSITGKIYGLEKVGIYNGHSNATYDATIAMLNEKFKDGFTGVENLISLAPPASFDVSYDSEAGTVTISGATGKSYQVMGYLYTTMLAPDREVSKGTLLVRFEATGDLKDGGADVKYTKRQVVDYVYAKNNSGTQDTDNNKNDIVTIDGTTYYLVTEMHPHVDATVTSMIVNSKDYSQNVIGNLTYCVYILDDEGNPCTYSSF